jgi:hypothetical protein
VRRPAQSGYDTMARKHKVKLLFQKEAKKEQLSELELLGQ